MNKFIGHLNTINKHRFYVMKFCFKCGFYKRGLLHDLSKYSPVEFWSGVKYFQGDKSPIKKEKEELGFSEGWQHHKGHNPHHFEYWLDRLGTRENYPGKIPYQYVVEMLCDWLAAGIVYKKKKLSYNKPYHEPLEYYSNHQNERIFHKDTQELIEYFLKIIDEEGINQFCSTVRLGQKNSEIKKYLVK